MLDSSNYPTDFHLAELIVPYRAHFIEKDAAIKLCDGAFIITVAEGYEHISSPDTAGHLKGIARDLAATIGKILDDHHKNAHIQYDLNGCEPYYSSITATPSQVVQKGVRYARG